MVLTMENALVITPVKLKKNRKYNEERQAVCEHDRLRMQKFKWKMEDSKKRIDEKGGRMNRPFEKEECEQGTNSLEQAIPICPSTVTREWKSVLRPISYKTQVDMIRSLRDFRTMTMNRQRQPLTTLHVRWQENRTGFIYSLSHLEYIFGHFGKVICVRPQSLSSALVTFDSIAGACRAKSMKNIGVERYPLHVSWLPKAWQNRYWVKKETIPTTFIITNQENPIKRAISHPSQIHCSHHVCSVKGCPNKAVIQS